MFKLLSWNIRQGGGKRVEKIIATIAEHNPHVVIFSEFRNNKQGALLRTRLLMQGYIHQFTTASKSDTNSVLILSKLHGNSQLFRNDSGEFPDNLVKVEFDAFFVIGMYLPHKKKHILFDVLINQAKLDKPGIFAGDFNTGNNYIVQKSNSFWYTDHLETLEAIGYVDAFRIVYPDQEEYSWFSHQGNGYRYDHTWLHEDLKPLIKDCYYDQSLREAGVSDHAPMILELGA